MIGKSTISDKNIPAPSAEEFVERLKASLTYCLEADDRGSVDFEMARWQEWVKSWGNILDEDGGL